MVKILLVMIGGSLGTLCRYGIGLGAARILGPAFPWGTLCVNLAGSYLIGLVFQLARQAVLGPEARLFCMTGFIGGMTTFSSLALETVNLYAGAGSGYATLNFLINNFVGLALVLAGMGTAKALF